MTAASGVNAAAKTRNAPLKVRPRIWIGLTIYVGYTVVVFIVQRVTGIPYIDFGKSGSDLFFGAGLSLIIGAILLAITTSLLGWWRPALFDRHHAPRWTLIAPILMAVALAINLGSTDWGAYDVAFFGASIVLILVGFTEEITTRGLLLTALRSRLGEGWVWFITSALFGLMHLINALAGQDLGPTLQQVGFAFLGGTIFYILRRASGTLIWAMVLHGLWDFSTFAVTHGEAGPLAGLGATLYIVAGLIALITVTFVIRRSNEIIEA